MPEVVPNEELHTLVLQMYAMWEGTGGIDGWADLFPGTRPFLAGIDPEQYLTGNGTAVNVLAAAARLMPTWVVRRSNPRAHSCGDVGWVSDEPEVAIGELFEFRARLTATFVVEHGHWRIIQYHFSVPQRVENVLPKRIDQSTPSTARAMRTSHQHPLRTER